MPNLTQTIEKVQREFREKDIDGNEIYLSNTESGGAISREKNLEWLAQAIRSAVAEAFRETAKIIEKKYEEIAIFTEKLDTAIMKDELLEGFTSEDEMKRAIDYGLIEMRILEKALAEIKQKQKEYLKQK